MINNRYTSIRTFRARPLLYLFILLCASFVIVSANTSTAHATPITGFNPGRIIDDGVFTNSTSMSPGQIQSFLSSKVPTCDTWGTQISEFGGGTRAQWATARGYPPPYTCLKDYSENGTSAAQIIYNIAQQYQINPQVFIVLLQKEQALVTDTWPLSSQYRTATGYGCPDTAACDTQYYGFTNQVTWSARMFRSILNNSPTWYTPYLLGDNYIQWNPSGECGGSTVYIQNRSTQALYNYTPYQPNQASLNAGYGMGDSCSSYGNRNFYIYFTDWFGATHGGDPVSTDIRLTTPITTSPAQPIPGEPMTITYTVKNFSTLATTYETSVLQCRLNTAINCDSTYGNSVTINPDDSKTFTHTIIPTQGGSYSLVPFFLRGGIWYRYGTENANANNIITKILDMRIVTPITMTPNNPSAGQPVSTSFSVKNFGTLPVTYQTSIVQCRLNVTTGCDSNYGGAIVINPGETLPVVYYLTPPSGGDYMLVPYYMENGIWYKYNTIGTSSANSLQISLPDMRLTTPIIVSPAQPIPGQTATVTYTVKNFSASPTSYQDSVLQCRSNSHINCDSAYSGALTIGVGESRTFTHTIPVSHTGPYTFTPYFLHNGTWYKYIKELYSNNVLGVDIPVYVADMRLTTPIVISPAQPIPNQSTTVTYTVKNFGQLPAFYQNSILQCRINTYTNCDSVYSGPLTIDAGVSRTFTHTIQVNSTGTYTFAPYLMQNDVWRKYTKEPYSNNVLTLGIY